MKIRNGQFSGKGQTSLGRMCAYMLNGVNVVRSIPDTVKVTITDSLLNRRARFAALSKLVKALTPVFIMHTLPMSAGQNYRNPATTANSPAVTVAGAQNVTIDYTSLVLSKGSLATQPASATQASAGAPIVVTWTPSTAVGTSPTDTVYVVAYNQNEEIIWQLEDDARSAGTISIPTTGLASGDRIVIYAFVKSSNGAFWSDSTYIETIALA